MGRASIKARVRSGALALLASLVWLSAANGFVCQDLFLPQEKFFRAQRLTITEYAGAYTEGRLTALNSSIDAYVFRGNPVHQLATAKDIDLNLVYPRGDYTNLGPQAQSSSYRFNNPRETIGDAFQAAQKHLYREYYAQGPERRELIPTVINQDREELSEKVVHFLLSVKDKPLARAQLLVSKSTAEPTHIERHWKEKLGPLSRRHPNESLAELGRLTFIDPNPGLPEAAKWKPDELLYFHWVHFLRLTMWVNNSSGFDRVLMQVNPAVYRRMRMSGLPIDLGEVINVSDLWKTKDGREVQVTERIVSFDKPAMIKFEDALMRKILGFQLKKFLEVFKERKIEGENFFFLRVFRDQQASLKRLGLIETGAGSESLQDQSRVVPVYLPASSESVVFRWRSDAALRTHEQMLLKLTLDQAERLLGRLQFE